ncbi:MAG: tetratricopeptide repeat protein [Rhodospirillales bacterium]|nr:tetratricopeptide repeat protein [Rhodospirillales bacterium]
MAKPLTSAKRNQLLQRAVAALEGGNAGAAYKAAVQVARQNASDVDALIMLSQAAPGTGRIDEAIRLFSVAMKSLAPREDLLICWGNLKAAAGDLSGATECFQNAVTVAPRSLGAPLNLANVLLQAGKADEAVRVYDQVIKNGAGWQAQYGLANASVALGNLQAAERAFVSVLDDQPQHVGALNNLGRILMDRGFYDQAAIYLEKAEKLQPNNPGVILNLGGLRRRQGAIDEAVLLTKRAIAINPDLVAGYSNLADVLEMANRLEDAEAAVDAGLAKFPGNAGLLVQAARLDRRAGRIQQAVDRLSHVEDDVRDVKGAAARHQELGVLYDKLDQPAEAFDHFSQAKHWFGELSHQLGITSDLYFGQVAAMQAFVDEADLAALDPVTVSDGRKDPCFMIGFLRSGTTLLHQILDSHPEVVVVDESPMALAAMDVVASSTGGYPGGLAELDDSTVQKARDAYFSSLDEHLPVGAGEKLVIDKFPFNTMRAPLLWRLFPEAKFVFSARHPMDVCLSCFMQAFQPSAVTSPFLSMAETVHAYRGLMQMWLDFSGKIDITCMTVRYEDLIADQEGVSAQLIDFIGVPWNDAVMRFYETAQQSSSVSNPSYHQVIQPIYSDAAQRWRRYETQLAEHEEPLRPFLTAFGYDVT